MIQRERKKSNKIETLVGNLNNSNVTTRDGIENVKRNSKNMWRERDSTNYSLIRMYVFILGKFNMR